MLKGAANTAILTAAHIHPTRETLFDPSNTKKEIATTNPNTPKLSIRINRMVNICKYNQLKTKMLYVIINMS